MAQPQKKNTTTIGMVRRPRIRDWDVRSIGMPDSHGGVRWSMSSRSYCAPTNTSKGVGRIPTGWVNCNSTKGDKDVLLGDVRLPDRDNTAAAYEYNMDGRITIPARLTMLAQTMARRTLRRVGLDRPASAVIDSTSSWLPSTAWRIYRDLVDCPGQQGRSAIQSD